MGFLASGRKVDESPVHVRYTFGRFPDDPEGGIITLPVHEPEDAWTIDGTDGDERPKCAVAVAVKAVRLFRRSGVWPDVVVYAS